MTAVTENEETEIRPGPGNKECPHCGTFVPARKGTCTNDNCGLEIPKKEKSDMAKKTKKRNRFAALSVTDFKLIWEMAKAVESGKKLVKPTEKKPDANAAFNAVGDSYEELKIHFKAWEVWEASLEMTPGSKDKLTEAITGVKPNSPKPSVVK